LRCHRHRLDLSFGSTMVNYLGNLARGAVQSSIGRNDCLRRSEPLTLHLNSTLFFKPSPSVGISHANRPAGSYRPQTRISGARCSQQFTDEADPFFGPAWRISAVELCCGSLVCGCKVPMLLCTVRTEVAGTVLRLLRLMSELHFYPISSHGLML
jgi:hypothetical protein